ncbi:hypothetical protein SAMD00019534_049010 [Acytostelium subglobosum LB1]|uniref:hypothetical protein n=1 Tax=Acytostelium subglobosum LB1 TaxID=1410327 RepID=UPI0006447B4F|nr:hypothetical protein SAMD00019534_049010 [Acytostelium subglobosum LB1]GAM21726.1 hypothetical protein SAMD00019534_049010 [Acytostelium subglobosum LB1]|eukprot:XP_012754826.1 hypothetical protein SAMD00019534_049010 [Acytostelium subglobosum LB1]
MTDSSNNIFYNSIIEIGPEPFAKQVIDRSKSEPGKVLETCLSMLKSNQDQISTLYNDFTQLEREYFKDLGYPDLELGLLYKEKQALIGRVIIEPIVKLAFTGATYSGKSTLISSLLDGLPLPTARSRRTGRFTVIRYAELENAKLYFCHLNTETSKLDPDGQVISLSQYPTTESLRPVLAEHLGGGYKSKGEEIDENKAAVTQIGVIEYPISLLKSGLEIYDLLGFCYGDKPCIKELRQSIIKHINPHGIVFCYSNPAFDKGETEAYNDLIRSRWGDDSVQTNISKTFFANTMFDLFYFLYDIGLSVEEMTTDMIEKEEKKRFDILPKESREVAYKYSLVNAIDLHCRIDKDYIGCDDFIFHRFLERLATWIVSLHQRRYAKSCDGIATGCNSFFESYNGLRLRIIGRIAKKSWLDNGIVALENLRPILLSMIDTTLKSTMQHFEDFLLENDLYNKAIAQAKSIVHPEYANVYAEVFKKEFMPWFNVNVLTPFIDVMRGRINSTMERAMKIVFDSKEDDTIWKAMDIIHQSFIANFNEYISTEKIVIGSVGGIIPSMISLLVVPKKIDDDFKVELTNKVFNKIRLQVKAMDMRTKLAETINKAIDLLRDYIPKLLEQHTMLRQKMDLMSNMTEYKTKFGIIGAEALSALNNVMDPSYRPVKLSTVDQEGGYTSAAGRVYKGTLRGEPVVIKTMPFSIMIGEADQIAESMFFEEMNNSYQLTNSIRSSKYLLPLLGVFNDVTKMEWQVVYPLYDCNLFKYLHRRITQGNFLTWSETLSIAFDIASCIELLHKYYIIHRDIKLENILINYDKDTEVITHLTLCNYGANTNAVARSPDIKSNVDDYTMDTESVDIYSLSCILYELIPRNTLQRSHNGDFKHINDAPDQYRQLIMDCAQIDPNMRPNINSVKETLSSIVL